MLKNTENNKKMYLGKITREINQVLTERGVKASCIPTEIVKAAVLTGDVEPIKTYLDGGMVFYRDLDAIAETLQYLDSDSEELANLFDSYFIGVIERSYRTCCEDTYVIVGKGSIAWANRRLNEIIEMRFNDADYMDWHLRAVSEEEYNAFQMVKALWDSDYGINRFYAYLDAEDPQRESYLNMIQQLSSKRKELEKQLNLEDHYSII